MLQAVFLFVAAGLVNYAGADELIQAHVVWRHGDRSPLQCYPTDPNLAYWQGQPWGELSTIGMHQQYQQGLKMKQRYIQQLKFVNATYNRNDIYVRSSYSPRCIQSALSNMAGFYSSSSGTYPTDSSWPAGWTPVPIHSLEHPNTQMLDTDKDCPRVNELYVKRGENAQFIEFEAEHAAMLLDMSKNSGEQITQISEMNEILDCWTIEKYFRKLPQPSWVTDSLYNQSYDLHWRRTNFFYGMADFGQPDDNAIFQVLAGPLITEIVNRMQSAQNMTKAEDPNAKLFVYSAHDDTLELLLGALGCKKQIIGMANPDYAAMVSFELWKSSSYYYVNMWYSANMDSPFVNQTPLISGCGGQQNCPFTMFYNRNRPFYVKNIRELCDKVL